MNNIETTMRDGLPEEKCPRECAYCKHFHYLNGSDDIGFCSLRFAEWQDESRNQVTCTDALDWFGDNVVYDDYECDRTDFEEE